MNNPNILWAQDRNRLFLTIEIEGMCKKNIEILGKEIILNKDIEERYYKLDLYGEVCPETSSFVIMDNLIKLNLKKKCCLLETTI